MLLRKFSIYDFCHISKVSCIWGTFFQLQTYFLFYSRINLPRYEKIIPAQGEGQRLIITEEVKVFTAPLQIY